MLHSAASGSSSPRSLLAAHAHKNAACLPEHSNASGVFDSPAWSMVARVPESVGYTAGHWSASALSPAAASASCTARICSKVPRCDAHAIATCAPRSGAPALSAPMAWNGLRVERAKMGRWASPRARITSPPGESTTTVPRWRDSIMPPRVATASSASRTGVAASAMCALFIHPIKRVLRASGRIIRLGRGAGSSSGADKAAT